MFPALAVSIIHDHEVICARGFGVTSVEDGGVPVTPQTLFRVGSVTKALTGTAIMCLVDQGLVHLDAPVQEVFALVQGYERAGRGGACVRAYAAHSYSRYSNIRNSAEIPRRSAAGIPKRSQRASVTRSHIYSLVAAQPGTLWSYSNGGIHILGYIIEVVTGIPYGHSRDARVGLRSPGHEPYDL